MLPRDDLDKVLKTKSTTLSPSEGKQGFEDKVYHVCHPPTPPRVTHCCQTLTIHEGRSDYPEYASRVDPSVLSFILSLHRHPHICIPFSSRFICCS